MPKYLIQASYSAAAIKGLLAEGGSGRKKAVEQALKPLRGKLESLYFSFGQWDAFSVVDLPDNVTAAALSLAIGATGMVDIATTPLLTTAELDAASKKSVKYRPPAG